MATFGTLVARLQDHFSTGSGSAARALRQLNEYHRRILNLPGCEKFRRSTIDVAVAAGETLTRLPATFTRYEHLVNVTANLPLIEKSLAWYRTIPPTTYTTGSPFAYIDYGRTPVLAQPVAAGTKTYAASSSAGDTTQVLYLRVRLATGQEIEQYATLTGATPVQIGTWTNAVEIVQAFLTAAPAGTVTLAAEVGMTTIYGYIYAGTTQSMRSAVILVPTPSASLTLRVDGVRSLDADLLTTDQHWLGDEWDHLLELGARVLEYEKQDDDRYARMKVELEVEIKRFKYQELVRPDQTLATTRARVETASNLGPYFPAGRW